MPVKHRRELLTIFAIVFMDLFGFGLILPLLPYIAERYGAHATTIGLLTASYSFFQFIAGPILGRLSDQYGRKKLLVISQFGSALGYLTLALAHSLPTLFFARIVDGITGGNISIAQAYIADITDKNSRAKGMGLLGAAFGLGFMLGPAIGGFLSRFGFAVPAYFATAFALLTTLATTRFLRETVDLKRASRSPNTRFNLKTLLNILTTPTLGVLIVSFFFLSFAFSGIQGTYALFTERLLGWGPQQVGYIFALIGIIAIITQLKLLPALLSRFQEKQILIFSIPLLSLGFTSVGLARSLPTILLANTLIPLGNSLANPTLSALASEEVKDTEYGGTLGLLQSAGSLGRILGPILGGLLFESMSPSTPYFTSAVIFLGVFFLLYTSLFPRRPRS